MIKNNVKEISSLKSIIEILKKDKLDEKGSVWYRGQSDSRWKLLPAYHRLSSPPSEHTLMKRFKQNAYMLIEHKPANSFDWLFLMQHYGVPTRLLDWSESPLVAIYFAVEKNPKLDGSFWALLPTKFNENARIQSEEDFFVPSFDDVYLENYRVEVLSQEKVSKFNPIAAISTRNNSRIQAQLGVFTISHRDKTPIENIGDKKHIFKYIIRKEQKGNILDELKLLGISRCQIFPELDKIGEVIKESLR